MLWQRELHWGDTSNFDFSDRSSRVGNVRAANISLITLVAFFVGLRLFVRGYLVRKIFVDDVLIVIAAAFTITLPSVCIAATHNDNGLGTHVLYACAIAFTKMAIIACYLRFIQCKKFRWVMYGTAFLIFGIWVTGVLVTIFQCRPVSAAWDFTMVGGKCINIVDYFYASPAITVATDVILCILPCPYLWKLHMPKKQRLILCILFGGGAGACVASIVRIAYLHTLRKGDVTYQCVPALILTVIECSLGIIYVSIPPLRPLAAHFWPRSMRTRLHSSKGTANTPKNSSNSAEQSQRRQSDNVLTTSGTTLNRDDDEDTDYGTAGETNQDSVELLNIDSGPQVGAKGKEVV